MIGYIFTEIAKVNWERHLPSCVNFWENALFYSGTYKGNPLELHKHLHRVMPLEPRHFDQWIRIFNETIDELFNGPKADLKPKKGPSIAQIMQREYIERLSDHSIDRLLESLIGYCIQMSPAGDRFFLDQALPSTYF